MNYEQLLDRIIDDGIAAAKADYADPRDADKLKGSLAGFESCRGKSPAELMLVYEKAMRARGEVAMDSTVDNGALRRAMCAADEVEWTCNCVSAVLLNEGRVPLFGWMPTALACLKVAEIVGVCQP